MGTEQSKYYLIPKVNIGQEVEVRFKSCTDSL